MSDQPDNPSNQYVVRGQGSFCIPRAALNALIDAQANAYEICTYLVLARFTDASGQFSTASISAVNRYTGANKVKNGPVDRAIQRLKTIRAKKTRAVHNGKSGRAAATIEQVEDLGPILFDRAEWTSTREERLPDGPTERGIVQFALPDFGEPLSDRVWFGGNLVKGISSFTQPLKAVKNAGDVAARFLLLLYMAQDMETWGGIPPIGNESGPWQHYEPVAEDINLLGQARLIRSKAEGRILSSDYFTRTPPKPVGTRDSWNRSANSDKLVWNALEALQSAGLVYEVVTVLNRNPLKRKFASGDEYGGIPDDAEPLYELDSLSAHGFKPEGEEGIGAATAKTAGELGHPVALEGGRFDGTYAAIVPAGNPAMVAGIYRLRFRVANTKNAGVKGAWALIHQNNRDAFELIQKVRAVNRLPLLPTTLSRKRDDENASKLDTGMHTGTN